MSLEQLYIWQAEIAFYCPHLGYWQALNIAMYSLGIMLARHCAPSRVSEKLGVIGKPMSVQRRLERFIDNMRIDVRVTCQAWTRWVIGQLGSESVILLVDETHLGECLSVMVVGLAYRGCCIPLAWWCYSPHAWPMKQVDLIKELLGWTAAGIPEGCIPMIEADRGIGCSSALVQVVMTMIWYFLFRVQKQCRFRTRNGKVHRMADMIKPGERWSGRGEVFKKAGWIPATIHLIWLPGYAEPWCLITNCPDLSGDEYATRYWQEAGFRDLKSDGWQWQTSRIVTPDHADRLLLVMAIAYALALVAGSIALADPNTFPVLKLSTSRTPFSVFRLGLRLLDYLATRLHLILFAFSTGLHDALLPIPSPPALKSVGA